MQERRAGSCPVSVDLQVYLSVPSGHRAIWHVDDSLHAAVSHPPVPIVHTNRVQFLPNAKSFNISFSKRLCRSSSKTPASASPAARSKSGWIVCRVRGYPPFFNVARFLGIVKREPSAAQSEFPTLREELPNEIAPMANLRYVVNIMEIPLHLLATWL